MLDHLPVLIAKHTVKLAQIPRRTTGVLTAATKKEPALERKLCFRILVQVANMRRDALVKN